MTEIFLFRGIARFASTLWKDTSGIVLPYVTVMLVVFVGLSLLAIDGARLVSSYTQMQTAADALALAGGAELDRRAGAIAKATAAINNLLSNQAFGMGVATPAIQATNITFYETLPAADRPLSEGTTTTNDFRARFVAVSVGPKTIQTIFPVWSATFNAGATAVAGGREDSTCQQTPMFICNPKDTPGLANYDDGTLALPQLIGKTTRLQLAQNSQYFPGNFGWTQPHFNAPITDQCGAGNPVTQNLARNRPPGCFVISTMDTQTGNIANANDGINTRFDLYSQSFNGCRTNPNYSPGRNVRKGWTPGPGQNGACNPTQQLPSPAGNRFAMGLPLDNNLIANGAPDLNTTLANGNGQWTCGDITRTAPSASAATAIVNGPSSDTSIVTLGDTSGITQGMQVTIPPIPPATTPYVGSVFHPSQPQNPQTVVTNTTVLITPRATQCCAVNTDPPPITFQGYWNTAHPTGTAGHNSPPVDPNNPSISCVNNNISRDFVFNWELGQNPANQNYTGDASPGGEVGGPTCSSPDTSLLVDRRYVNVAVVNCQWLQDNAGYSLNGHQDNLPVAAIGKFLLTNPVDAAADPIYGELSAVCSFTQLNPLPLCSAGGVSGGVPPPAPRVQLYR